jgi:prepilin-type N-terminal cleavage/methylation domain-containing protein
MMKKQSGFTLIELAVVIVILTGLAVYGMEGLGNALDFKSRVDTDNRVKSWRKAIESVYLDNSATIDVQTTAILKLVSGTTINPATPATSGASIGKCTMVAANMLEFANRGGYSATDMIQDGHHNSFCLYITPRISTTVSGTTLFYHSVAIVSPGRNGKIDTGTTLDAAGNLTLAAGSDDIGVLFDGRKFASDRYNQTIAAMQRTVDAYSAYYAARYQSDSTRSLSNDYFSCGATTCPSAVARWDTTGEMISTCTGAIAMVQATGTSPHNVLGLSSLDVTDGWGNLFTMDNCTDAVRSPASTIAARQNPPYTAQISATLPGGSVLSMTAVGQI